MKRGFTMIELVFVIVIIGVLAAIAIPKLTDTKNAADGANIASNLATCINEIGSVFLVKGTMDTTTAVCTKAKTCYDIVDDAPNAKLTVKDKSGGAECDAAQKISTKNNTSSSSGMEHVFK